jgi:hypothetical protein
LLCCFLQFFFNRHLVCCFRPGKPAPQVTQCCAAWQAAARLVPSAEADITCKVSHIYTRRSSDMHVYCKTQPVNLALLAAHRWQQNCSMTTGPSLGPVAPFCRVPTTLPADVGSSPSCITASC